MDTGFFTSKPFVVGAIVAAVILGIGVSAYAFGGGPSTSGLAFERGCDPPALGGIPIAVEPNVTVDRAGERRTVVYALDAAAFQGGEIDLCAIVGDIVVEPAPGSRAELVFVIVNDAQAAVAATEVDAAFSAQGDRLLVAGWEPVAGKSRMLYDSNTAHVQVTLRVPASGAWAVRAATDVGDARVDDLLLGDVELTSDVGNLALAGVDLQGNATLRANVGDARADLASVQAGRIDIVSEVGDVDVALPQRADVGYDAVGETDVGEVELRLGQSEDYGSEGDGPGERERAKTAGFASKPTKVTVEATTSVGDVRIAVEP